MYFYPVFNTHLMYKAGITGILLLLISCVAFSQGPCYLPGQTPPLAIPVCGTNAFVQDSVSICDGQAIPVPCQDGIIYADKNPFWYKFHCFQSGVFGFLIVPNIITEDYDWMMFDITGRNPMDIYTDTSLIVAYNWSGVPGATGTSPNSVDSNSCASAMDTTNGGIVTPNQTKMPNLIVGHDYLLMVSHFTPTQYGYQITFGGGTAVITDSLRPFMKYARAICDGTTMMLVTNKKMRCTSLDADGSDFSLSPPAANIIGAVGNCYGGFDFDTIRVTLGNPLPPGKYNLVVNLGKDGNTLEDICYNDIPVGSSIPVNVYPMNATPMDSINVTDSCSPSSVTLVFRRPMICNSVAPDGSDFIISGPSPVKVASTDIVCNSDSTTAVITVNFSAPVLVGGNYTITLQKGTDGNTVIDECSFESIAGQSLQFHVAAPILSPIVGFNNICQNQSGIFRNATPNGTWISGNPQVLTIDQNGNAHAISSDTVSVFYRVIGANGCPGLQQHLVIVNPVPFIQPIQGGRNVCLNNADTLTTTVGGTWYSGDTAIVKIDSVTGIALPVNIGNTFISYKITNANGCSDSAKVNISVNPSPVIAPIAGADSVCINQTSLYTSNTPKGIWVSEDSALAFVDYSGMIYPHLTGNVKIKYTVINKKGCSDSVFKNITINPLPAIAPVKGLNDICVGKSTLLTNSVLGGNWWSVNNQIASIDINGKLTTYLVGQDTIRYIVTGNGCTDSVYTIITVRPLPYVDTISGTTALCAGDSALMRCIPTGGIWTITPAISAAINNQGWVTANNGGNALITYIVTSPFGCIDSTRKIITIHPLPVPDFVLKDSICLPAGMGYFLNKTTPAAITDKYVWDFGDSSNPGLVNTANPAHQFAAPVQASGYYIKLSVKDLNNCAAQKTKWLPPASIHTQPSSALGTKPTPPEVCLGTAIQLFDSSHGSIIKSIWYLGNNEIDTTISEFYTYSYPGTYWVTHNIIDAHGCLSTPSQVLVTIDSFPVVDAGNLLYVPIGSSVILTPAIIANNPTVRWTPDVFLNDNTLINPVCSPQNDTTYTLYVWNKEGCMSKDTIRIIVLDNIQIPNAFSPNNDGYHDTWIIPELSKYPAASVVVFNRYGQKIFESSNGYTHPWNGTYNGTKVPVGVYYYVIKRNDILPVLSGPVSIFW